MIIIDAFKSINAQSAFEHLEKQVLGFEKADLHLFVRNHDTARQANLQRIKAKTPEALKKLEAIRFTEKVIYAIALAAFATLGAAFLFKAYGATVLAKACISITQTFTLGGSLILLAFLRLIRHKIACEITIQNESKAYDNCQKLQASWVLIEGKVGRSDYEVEMSQRAVFKFPEMKAIKYTSDGGKTFETREADEETSTCVLDTYQLPPGDCIEFTVQKKNGEWLEKHPFRVSFSC